ncbi:Mu-like prophage protein gp37 [Rodentibacter pneumotropicus]|uniref:Mu-like prophage protein gp37 n=1 Tax=Rodentibacter pneumotropicus TaxID=758 RepID=A0A3S4VZW1_9PAST|nr:Mu-like prophage protein gp37 [Rodentibacter pneumotropicus]
MITQIEQALVERLQRGLGRLVNTVKSYGGELDDESLSTSRLPICLVTFGGARIERMGTNAKRHQSTANFVIIVAVNSLRSNLAARQGGVDKREVGVNQLITAVRRLLDSQTLGRLVKPLKPTKVRTIFNNATFKGGAITAYAIEYDAVYDDLAPLEDGLFPEETRDVENPDYVFTRYQGEHSEPAPMLERIGGNIYDPTNGASVSFEVETKE